MRQRFAVVAAELALLTNVLVARPVAVLTVTTTVRRRAKGAVLLAAAFEDVKK
jgi:hypothetical protein